MCGIAGFAGNFSAQLLGRMNQCIAHRGPDGAGKLLLHGAGTCVGLAHRRLAILDLSPLGAQPMGVECPRCDVHSTRAPSAGLWLIYNGEIYNFPELRAELEARGHQFQSRTDSEVLLHLYADLGREFLDRLNGIFSLAIYDGRERGRGPGVERGDLLIARDGMGVKPLYYAQLPQGFLFASELKALLQEPTLSRDIDPAAVHYHLAYLWAPAPTTMLRDVRKLEPGYAVLVRAGAVVETWCHYDLPYTGKRLAGDEDTLARALADKVYSAVERQMVSDVPVGAFLSGGLDSSAVVAMMRKARPDFRPRCYTIAFRDMEDVEGNPADLPYARKVAKHLDVDLETLEIDASEICQLDRMLYFLDEPQADPAPINALLIAQAAQRDGTKVLLSGAGGDDLFTGYRRHQALDLERAWSWLPQAARSGLGSAAQWAGSSVGGMTHAPVRRFAKAFSYAGYAPEVRMASYFWWTTESVRRSLYSPSFAALTRDLDTAAPLLRSLGRIPGETDPLNRMLYLEAKHFLADHNLSYTDKMGMAAGVEVRVPLLDRELVDFATSVPVAMKQRGNVGKALFKRAMQPYLPHDVIYRKKTGFGAPLRHWLHNELRERLRDLLGPEAIRRRGWFDAAAVERLIEDDRAGRVDAAYTIFALLCLESWCRMFVDVPVPAAC
ncbi:MAG: asnB [Gemmatimonadetes bacterium]|nr:asnB [Gemmatimonadota bacterium]